MKCRGDVIYLTEIGTFIARRITEMPEVLGFWRMAGEYDYLMRVQVADMKRYDDFYKRLVNSVPGLSDVTSSFAMEQIKYTTSLPIE